MTIQQLIELLRRTNKAAGAWCQPRNEEISKSRHFRTQLQLDGGQERGRIAGMDDPMSSGTNDRFSELAAKTRRANRNALIAIMMSIAAVFGSVWRGFLKEESSKAQTPPASTQPASINTPSASDGFPASALPSPKTDAVRPTN